MSSVLSIVVPTLLAIVALGVLIIIHEGGHFLAARLSGMRVDRFSIGFGPAIAQFERNGTIFQIGMVPLGGFVQIAGLNPGEAVEEHVIERDGQLIKEERRREDPALYPNRPVYQRLATIFAGPATNYFFAALLMSTVYLAWGVPMPGKLPVVSELVEGMPAAAAGLELGDEVVTVDGKAVKDFNDVGPIVNASAGRPFDIVVEREGVQKTFPIAAKKDGERYRIGIGIMPRPVFVKGPVGEALREGLSYPWEATRLTVHNFAQIFAGKQKAEFSGPIGIVRVLKSEISRSAKDGLAMVAMISSLLGFFNLLPFPGLDGGRLMFLGYEATRRKPVDAKVEQTIHLVGILSLFAFLIVVSWKDVVKLIHH